MRVRQRAVKAARVLQAFNTWAFKREQPSEPDKLLGMVASAIARHQPISFVLYWGKGTRHAVGDPEIACLDFLTEMGRRIEHVYKPGATFTLILTDTHADLNGHARANTAHYFQSVVNSAEEYGFACCHLSDLVALMSEVNPISDPAKPAAELLANLEKCAAKWYRGEDSTTIAASQYYQMNMVEKRAVELVFPTSIFITFNGRDYREMFPSSLPVFYMYSMRKGVSVKPWFAELEVSDEMPPSLEVQYAGTYAAPTDVQS